MERRAEAAFAVFRAPWRAQLETRDGIGGSSFVGAAGDEDDELYVDLHLQGERVQSPDARLDALLDFVAHAAEDVPMLIAEIRRLRSA